MSDTIETRRLTLRKPDITDAGAIVHELDDVEVSRWLSQVPHPYTREDAESFIAAQTSGRTFVMCQDDIPIGCIGTVGEFGYWLGRRHWGQGFATEASKAILDWHFETDGAPLRSGHAIGNERSRRVLLKMGFVDIEVVDRRHKVTGKIRKQQVMALTVADWEART